MNSVLHTPYRLETARDVELVTPKTNHQCWMPNVIDSWLIGDAQ